MTDSDETVVRPACWVSPPQPGTAPAIPPRAAASSDLASVVADLSVTVRTLADGMAAFADASLGERSAAMRLNVVVLSRLDEISRRVARLEAGVSEKPG